MRKPRIWSSHTQFLVCAILLFQRFTYVSTDQKCTLPLTFGASRPSLETPQAVFIPDARGEIASSSSAMASAEASISSLPQPSATATASTSISGVVAYAQADRLQSGSIRVRASVSMPPTSTADKTTSPEPETSINGTSQTAPTPSTEPQPMVEPRSQVSPPSGPSAPSESTGSSLTTQQLTQPRSTTLATRPSSLKVHNYDYETWPKKMQTLWTSLSSKPLGSAYDDLVGLFVTFERVSGFEYWDVCMPDLLPIT